MASESTSDGSAAALLVQEQAIAQLLSSEALAKSERARELLAYLFEQHKAGEANQVKGFTIAMDVFGRDENFDPNNDALVRVHMGRLRDLLANYYSGEGACSRLRVLIPKGRYVLQFQEQEGALAAGGAKAPANNPVELERSSAATSPEAQNPSTDQPGPTPIVADRSFRRLAMVTAFAAVTTLAVLLVFVVPQFFEADERPIAANAPGGAFNEGSTASVLRSLQGVEGVQFLPRLTFAHVRGASYLESGQDPFALQLRSSLARFDTIQLVANGPLERIEGPRDVGRSYYSLVISQLGPDGEERAPDAATHRLELRHPNTGDILWTQFVARPSYGQGLGEDGAGEAFDPELIVLASRIAAMDGLLITHFIGVAGSNRLFDCLSLISPIVQDLPPSSAEAGVACLNRLIARGNRLPITHAFLALAIMETARSGSEPTAAGLIQVDSVAEAANEVLQQGLITAPESAALYAVQAHTQLFQTGDYNAAIGLSQAAIDRSSTSWAIWGSHARMLAMAGRLDAADNIVNALAAETGRIAPNWAFTTFLTSVAREDHDRIKSAATHLGGVSNPFYYSARIVAWHLASDFTRRNEMIERLRLTYPAFYANPPIFIRSIRLDPKLEEQFLLNLRQAGVYRLG